MKKAMVFILCLTLLAACFAGCGSSPSDSTPQDSPAGTAAAADNQEEAPQEPAAAGDGIPLAFWHINADGMENYMPDGFKERFESAYPQYDLGVTMVAGTADDFETKFNSAKMSNTLPDLCYLTLTSFASLGTRGEFLSLQDKVDGWAEKDDMLSAALEMGRVGGSYTGIGVAPAPVMLAYRTDMFEAAGLDPDQPPTNWEELADYAVRLTIKDDSGTVIQAGLDIPSIDYYHNVSAPFMLMNGATVVDEANGLPMLTEPAVVEALEYLYSIYSQGVTLAHDWQKSETVPFMNGIGAMSFTSIDNYNKVISEHPELDGKVRLASPISNKQSAAFCGYRLLAVTAGTDQPDGAWDLIQFFVSSEETTTRIDYGVIPVRISAQDYYVETLPEVGQTVLDTVAVGKGAFVVPWVSTLYKYYGPAYESIMQGIATPADAMEDAQRQILSEIGQ